MLNLTIKRSLLLVFVAVGVLTSTLAYIAVSSLNSVQGAANTVAEEWLPRVEEASRLKALMLELRVGYLLHMVASDEPTMQAAEQTIANNHAEVASGLKLYANKYNPSGHQADLIASISDGLAKYEALGKELVVLSRANDTEPAAAILGTMRKQVVPMLEDFSELVQANHDSADASVHGSKNTHASALSKTYATSGVVLVILLLSITYVLRGVTRPIQIITGAISKLAAGDTASSIPYPNRKDEIGKIAGAVEIFRKAAIANIKLEAEAKTQRENAEVERLQVTAAAEADAQGRLAQATAGLASGLQKLASGDLSFQISEPFSPDFEQLRHDLNAAVEQLGATLAAVAETTVSIDNGSREIATGSNDLSRRTEQQAASLEETAAALDEITANVSNSSKRADEARTIVMQTNASAVQSAVIVGKAVEAMQGIEKSSNQISNIIGVIDEIAFQTNLLALNAGVEAARAGDAGRGFAVVAQEVRELAQRSAQAAKEIKALIRTSATEVEGGVALVSETGEALRTIQNFVGTINQHMDAIAVSSKEQSVGLAEVNTAVNDMDQVTQKNAAMVEETNAASATLASESSRLRDLISRFKLPSNVADATALKTNRSSTTGHHIARTEATSLRLIGRKMASGAGKADDTWQEF